MPVKFLRRDAGSILGIHRDNVHHISSRIWRNRMEVVAWSVSIVDDPTMAGID